MTALRPAIVQLTRAERAELEATFLKLRVLDLEYAENRAAILSEQDRVAAEVRRRTGADVRSGYRIDVRTGTCRLAE
jgi:hypothetical protein